MDGPAHLRPMLGEHPMNAITGSVSVSWIPFRFVRSVAVTAGTINHQGESP